MKQTPRATNLSPVTEKAIQDYAKELYVVHGYEIETIAELISLKFKRKINSKIIKVWLAPYKKEAKQKRKEKYEQEKNKELIAFTKELNEALDVKDFRRMDGWLKKAEEAFEQNRDPRLLASMVKCIEAMRKIRIKETKADAKELTSSIAVVLAKIAEQKRLEMQKQNAIVVEVNE